MAHQLYGNTTLGTGCKFRSNNVEFRKVTDLVKAVKMKTAACDGKILAPTLQNE
uniref:Uncharacterized protein n=1 Tax=Terrapene triunguis TaxID=2587831 RepID=A0A674JKY4_9SAUR